jgi:hypothetical protein
MLIGQRQPQRRWPPGRVPLPNSMARRQEILGPRIRIITAEEFIEWLEGRAKIETTRQDGARGKKTGMGNRWLMIRLMSLVVSLELDTCSGSKRNSYYCTVGTRGVGETPHSASWHETTSEFVILALRGCSFHAAPKINEFGLDCSYFSPLDRLNNFLCFLKSYS